MNKVILFFCFLLSFTANAIEVPDYYKKVAEDYGIPPILLFAVANHESKPPLNVSNIGKPWPWTINCDGNGYYLKTKQQAIFLANWKIKHGMLCDLSIMQVNWYWNNHRFKSVEEAFDPYINIKVGAQILQEHYQNHGSWEIAVGKYHSPSNETRALKYREKVRNELAQIVGVKF